MSEYRHVKANSTPTPVVMKVLCPECGADLEYMMEEDMAGLFFADDAPICDDCGVVIEIPAVRISTEPAVFWKGGYP